MTEQPPTNTKTASPVTLQQIAEQCGVTKMTVARALHGWKGVSPQRAEDIRAVATAMGYVPELHDTARRLAYRKREQALPPNHMVALALPANDLSVVFFNELFQGALTRLYELGYATVTVPLGLLNSKACPGFDMMLRRGDIDGVITTSGLLYQRLAQLAGPHSRPIVCMLTPTLKGTCVRTDDEAGAYAAAQHLLSLGHRHLLQFVYAHNSQFRFGQRIVDEAEIDIPGNRLAGIRRAMLEAGLDPSVYLHLLHYWPDSIFPTKVSHHLTTALDDATPAGLHCIIQYLQHHPEVTAILGLNDANALHAWYLMRQLGRRVPDDISIIGFDDTDPMLDEQGRNLLTTVSLPLQEVGRDAAQCLVGHIEGTLEYPATRILPVQLTIRHSTAAAGR